MKQTAVGKLELNLLGIISFDSEELRQRYKEAIKQAKEMEKQQQDNFAIGFAEWTSYKYKYLETKGWFSNSYELEIGIFKSSKELLEIYKKEKGL